jgi:putative redox protein
LLIGHSLGGAARASRSQRDSRESKAVVTIGAPFEPSHVKHCSSLPCPTSSLPAKPKWRWQAANSGYGSNFSTLDGSRNNREAIGNLRKALLIFHSARDTTVSIDNAAQIFMAAKHPKSFISLDDADHLLTRKEDRNMSRPSVRLGQPLYRRAGHGSAARRGGKAGVVTVTGCAGETRFAQEIGVGKHHLRADEPSSARRDRLRTFSLRSLSPASVPARP